MATPEKLDTSLVLHQPFSFETHHQAFGSTYLEAILFPDGHLEYAVPSHQEKLIAILVKKSNSKSREEACSLCPKEYYYSFLDWLLLETGCVSVWTNFYIGEPNKAQQETLQKLQDAGVMHIDPALCQTELWRPYTGE